jgi:cell division septation protein DedD
VSQEPDEYREDDEQDEFASRSIFAAGWFRAVLVLTVLAIVVVVSLPYLLNWFEPASPPMRTAKPDSAQSPPSSVPPAGMVPTSPPGPTGPATAPPPAAAPAPPSAQKSPSGPAAPPQKEKPSSPTAAPPQKEKPSGAPATSPPKVASAPPQKSSAPAAPAAPAPPAAPKIAAEKAPPAAPAPKASPGKPAPEKAPASATAKPAVPTKVAKAVEAPSRPAATAPSKADGAATGGPFWIQVGAFKDPKNADHLAKTLRDQGFRVEVTRIAGGEAKAVPTLQHELFVTDAGIEKVNTALKGRGIAQPVSGGVAVKPAFSLQEAMAVSKQLSEQGLKVIIRPAASSGTEGSAAGTLHAVRVGGYPDRTRALAARDELKAKGHGTGFLAQGPGR